MPIPVAWWGPCGGITFLVASVFSGLANGMLGWWLYLVGIWLFMILMPAVEAAEQTVIQRVVPFETQGRVFGFAMTFEAAAAPVTAFMIAPLAEFWIIPYMDSRAGQDDWGWLLGEGDARGIALVFLVSGIASLLLALVALCTRSYRRLSAAYAAAPENAPVAVVEEDDLEETEAEGPA